MQTIECGRRSNTSSNHQHLNNVFLLLLLQNDMKGMYPSTPDVSVLVIENMYPDYEPHAHQFAAVQNLHNILP